METERKSEYIFPEVFVTGTLLGRPKDAKELCADVLCAWGICNAGGKPPANFGKGMVAIGEVLGFAPTDKNVTEYAKKKGWL